MSELSIREEHTPQQAPPPAPAPPSALERWAYDAQQAHRVAQSLAKTSFVPQSLRGRPDDITAAILAGQELGLQPMASLRAMDVIQGTPALRAHAMRGLVQSHGHSVQLVESSDTRCVMRGRRKGETDWQTVTWTIQRAQRLGLTTRDQWRKQPQTMLVARATAEICRLIAADVLYAAPYAAEELDGTGIPAPSVTAEPVTAEEILGDGDTDDEPVGEPDEHGDEPPVDPDAEAAEQYAAEVDGWPPVRTPGSGS